MNAVDLDESFGVSPMRIWSPRHHERSFAALPKCSTSLAGRVTDRFGSIRAARARQRPGFTEFAEKLLQAPPLLTIPSHLAHA